jgi:hypothetical protein
MKSRMKSRMKMYFLCLFVCTLYILSYGCATQHKSIIQFKDQGICQEIKSGRMWQIDKGGKFSSLEEAERYAASLQLGGYNDWRVPTREEYFQLHYIFSERKNNDCAMNLKGEYWSMPEGEEPDLGHWETYFLCGAEFKYVESYGMEGYVRAVRP